MKLIPYLFFPGTAEHAMRAYAEIFDGEIVTLQRFKDAPEGMEVEHGMEDKVMHGRIKFDDQLLYFSDGHDVDESGGFTLTLEFDSVDRLEDVYAALANGGEVLFKVQDMFWNARYGKVKDRFGMVWDLSYAYPQ